MVREALGAEYLREARGSKVWFDLLNSSMNRIWFGMAALVLSGVLVACPDPVVPSTPILKGKIDNYGIATAGTIKVYAVTNPRVDLSVSPLSFVALNAGATVIVEGTVSATGEFNLQLPSDTTMTLYSKPRVLPSQQSGCTVSSSGSSTANVAQIAVKVESNGATLGFLLQQSPGQDPTDSTKPATYYDIWHYWTNAAFGIQQTCAVNQRKLSFAPGWNNITARTTVSAKGFDIFDSLTTNPVPSGLIWHLYSNGFNGFSSKP
jgi:hypothetical protein